MSTAIVCTECNEPKTDEGCGCSTFIIAPCKGCGRELEDEGPVGDDWFCLDCWPRIERERLSARIATLEAALAEAERNGRLSADAVEVIKGQRDAAEQQLATERAAREKAEEERDLSRGAEWVSQSAQLRAESKLAESEAGAAAMRVAASELLRDRARRIGLADPGDEQGCATRLADALNTHPAGRALLDELTRLREAVRRHGAEEERVKRACDTADAVLAAQPAAEVERLTKERDSARATCAHNDGVALREMAAHAAELARVKAELEEFRGKYHEMSANCDRKLEDARSDLAAHVILLRNAEAEAREREEELERVRVELEAARAVASEAIGATGMDGAGVAEGIRIIVRSRDAARADAKGWIETADKVQRELNATESVRLAMVAAADEAKGEAARLAKALEQAWTWTLLQREAPPGPGHFCGPESQCDGVCVDWAGWVEATRPIRVALAQSRITAPPPPAPFCPHCGDASHAPGQCSAVCFTGGDSSGKRCECGGETKCKHCGSTLRATRGRDVLCAGCGSFWQPDDGGETKEAK